MNQRNFLTTCFGGIAAAAVAVLAGRKAEADPCYLRDIEWHGKTSEPVRKWVKDMWPEPQGKTLSWTPWDNRILLVTEDGPWWFDPMTRKYTKIEVVDTQPRMTCNIVWPPPEQNVPRTITVGPGGIMEHVAL